MSGQERLAAALEAANLVPFVYDEEVTDVPDGAEPLGGGFHHVIGDRIVYHLSISDILAADPALAQDIEDGTELRLLREALPAGWWLSIHECAGDPHVRVRNEQGVAVVSMHAATIAAAARACREALEART